MTLLRIRSFGLIAFAAAALAGPLAGAAQGATPAVVTKPAVNGTPQVGQPLTYTSGTWNPSSTVVDQWWSCTPTCAQIAGTTNNQASYTVQPGDLGATIEISETATDAVVGDTPASTTSAAVGPVTAAPPPASPTNTTPPSITGADILGQALTETGDVWTGSPTKFTYQWLRCTTATTCTAITDGTGAAKTYTLVAADVGDTMEVQMTASNSNPTASAVVPSGQTPTVVPPPPSFVAPPSISGTAQSGQTLTEGPAKWGTTWPPTSTAVQWYRCDGNNLNCQPVGTGTTYKLTDLDVGATMQVWETASNAGGSSTNYSNFSNAVRDASGVVPVPAAAPGSVPTIGGTLQLGRTLTAASAGFINNPSSFGNQWLRCDALGCQPIPGANDLTYTPTSADVGDSIAFSETASNSAGTSAAVQSGRTGTITAPSTTALQTSSSSPSAGQTVTLIATVTSAAGSVKPAGTVAFRVGSAAIPGCTGLALGNGAPTAVCQTSFPASVANVTAAYSATPGTFITGSTSSPATLIVGRAATSVTVATSAHATLGAKTTYTATVHPPAGSTLTPTGRITFTDGGKSIKGCGSKALAAHKAPCSVKYLGIKQHRIAAHYSGDANFAPSASITSHVLVQPKAPSGVVSVFMNWTFGFTPHSTRVKALTAFGLSTGIHITVTCSGGGCPFAHRTLTVPASGKCGKGKTVNRGCLPASSVNLTPIFHQAHLQPGTKVTLAITHRNWVGKYYRFTIRPSHLPTIVVSCLAVNGTRPGVGCSAR
jgi:hypothetical protein